MENRKRKIEGQDKFSMDKQSIPGSLCRTRKMEEKKDVEKWMGDHHPEPGYPNISKNEKLKELKLEKQNGTRK